MPSPVTCPSCGERLDIPADLRGTPVRCAACMTVFTPPAAAADEEVPAVRPARPVRAEPAPAEDEYTDDRDRPRKKRGGARWVWVLLGLVGLSTCACCGGCGALVYYLENPTFQPYTSAEGRFAAEFPGPVGPDTKRTLAGVEMSAVEARRDVAQESYFVYYGDVPAAKLKAGPEELLTKAADELLAKARAGQPTSKQPSTHAGHPAIDVHIQTEFMQPGMVARVVLAGKRLYVVGINGQVMPEQPRAEHFLQSFQVTGPGEAKK